MPINAVEYHLTGIPEEVAAKVNLISLTVPGDCDMALSPAENPDHIHVRLVVTLRKAAP